MRERGREGGRERGREGEREGMETQGEGAREEKHRHMTTPTSHSVEYLITIFLHSALYAATPIFFTSSGDLIPMVLSISYSTGKP